MQNLGGVLCSICLDYMVKPVTTKCGHSFCEYCLDEYFLLMDVFDDTNRHVQCVRSKSGTPSPTHPTFWGSSWRTSSGNSMVTNGQNTKRGRRKQPSGSITKESGG